MLSGHRVTDSISDPVPCLVHSNNNNNNCPTDHLSDDQWGDLECLCRACQAARTDGGLFTDTGVDERSGNERQGENDCEVKTIARSRGQRTDKVGANKTKEERVVQREKF